MRGWLVLLVVLVGAGMAQADPPVPQPNPAPPAAKPASPLTPEQAADALLAAVRAKNDAAL